MAGSILRKSVSPTIFTRFFSPLSHPTSIFLPPKVATSTKLPPFFSSRRTAATTTSGSDDGPIPFTSRRYHTILSIDGGGLRGIIPAIILEYLEAELQNIDGPEARVADYFDVIAGTSTGGCVTAMLTTPDDKGRPLFAANTIPQFYLHNAAKIFPKPKPSDPHNGPRYDGKFLHDLIKRKVGDCMLDEAITDIVIPSFDIKLMEPVIFNSFQAKREPLMNPKLADVCIGTSAAPRYLPPYSFMTTGPDNKSKTFNVTDGGVANNNPTMLAVSLLAREKLNLHNPNEPLRMDELLVLSLGTGTAKNDQTYNAADAATWVENQWMRLGQHRSPLLEMVSQGQAEMVDFYASILFRSSQDNNFLRIQYDKLQGVTAAMDDSAPETMAKLENIGTNLLREKVSRMNIAEGVREPVPHDGLNKDALTQFAHKLCREKNLRHPKFFKEIPIVI